MSTKYRVARTEIWAVIDLLFYPERWYCLGEVRNLCERLDVFYLDDVTRSRLMGLVSEGKLECRTFKGDYQWKLPLKQLSLPGFE